MNKLTTGQGVRVGSGPYRGQIGVIDFIDKGGLPYRIKLNIGGYDWFAEKNLTPLPKSWDTLAKGDVLVNEIGCEAKVLIVEGDVFLRSYWDDFDTTSSWCNKTKAQEKGWKIKNTEDDEEAKAIKLLEDRGRIKNGKIVT